MLIHWYRFSNWLYKHHFKFLPRLLYYLQYIFFNCSVPGSCELGEGTKFGYGGMAVVIHPRVVVGKNCTIGTCVTIGGKSGWYEVPIIGDNVQISSGAKILGPVRIGSNVVVGANAVIVKDVPSNCVVAGVPARIIRTEIDPNDYFGSSYRKRGGNHFPVTELNEV